MSDKLNRGDKFRISHELQNTLVDVAAKHRREQLPAGPTIQADLTSPSPVIVRVKNTTGTTLPRGAVLAVPDCLRSASNDEWWNSIDLVGETPDDGHEGKFAILPQGAAIGATVEAVLAGVVQTKVNMLGASHRWAEIEPSQTGRLKSGTKGSARILWVADTDGVQPAIVRLLAQPMASRCTIVGEAGGRFDADGLVGSPYSIVLAPSDSAGIWCFPDVSGQIANADGEVYHVRSPASEWAEPDDFEDFWLELVGPYMYAISVHTVWALPPLSLYDARDWLRAPPHDHIFDDHYDLTHTIANTTGQTVFDALNLRGMEKIVLTEAYYEDTLSGDFGFVELGRSSHGLWYNSGSGESFQKYGCHSGVFIPPGTASGLLPLKIKLRVRRLDTEDVGDPRLLSLQVRVDQITD